MGSLLLLRRSVVRTGFWTDASGVEWNDCAKTSKSSKSPNFPSDLLQLTDFGHVVPSQSIVKKKNIKNDIFSKCSDRLESVRNGKIGQFYIDAIPEKIKLRIFCHFSAHRDLI